MEVYDEQFWSGSRDQARVAFAVSASPRQGGFRRHCSTFGVPISRYSPVDHSRTAKTLGRRSQELSQIFRDLRGSRACNKQGLAGKSHKGNSSVSRLSTFTGCSVVNIQSFPLGGLRSAAFGTATKLPQPEPGQPLSDQRNAEAKGCVRK